MSVPFDAEFTRPQGPGEQRRRRQALFDYHADSILSVGNQPMPEVPQELLDAAGKACSLLKALAHEDRLLLLCHLADGEKNVSELQEILGVRQPTLSQQLARLRFEELVSTRRNGKEIYYSLASTEASRVIGLLYEMYGPQIAAPRKRSKRPARRPARKVASR